MGYFTNINYLEDFSPHLRYVVGDQGVTRHLSMDYSGSGNRW